MADAVINLTGTAGRKCVCSSSNKRSWLDHWKRGTKLSLPNKCCAAKCHRTVQVGAHVRHIGSDGRIPWIVPFCQYHNKRPKGMVIQLKAKTMLCGAAKVDCD